MKAEFDFDDIDE